MMEPQKGKQEENRNTENSKIYVSGDSTLQTDEEYRKDKNSNVINDDSVDVSGTANRSSDADKYAGSDRAGTGERKDNN